MQFRIVMVVVFKWKNHVKLNPYFSIVTNQFFKRTKVENSNWAKIIELLVLVFFTSFVISWSEIAKFKRAITNMNYGLNIVKVMKNWSWTNWQVSKANNNNDWVSQRKKRRYHRERSDCHGWSTLGQKMSLYTLFDFAVNLHITLV